MRDIKFRAWSTIRKPKMIEWKDLRGSPAVDIFEESEEWKVMQFTGLHDKNGKEIYEGDIVTTYGQNPDTIIFASGCFYLENAMQFYEATYWGDELEIIGNIYENPELLKSV